MKKEYWSLSLAILLIIVLAVPVSTVWITNNRIVDRAELNQKEFIEVISSLRSEPKIFSDTLKGSRIEQSKRLQESIVTLATLQLNDYHKMVIEEASANKVTLTLWATLLTLLSIVFTFLGIMELKDKIKEMEMKTQNLETTTTNRLGAIITQYEKKLKEMATKFQEDIDSRLINLGGNIKKIKEIQKTIEDNKKEIEDKSSFRLKLQSALLHSGVEQKATKIRDVVDLLSPEDKDKRAEAFYTIGLVYAEVRNHDDAIKYFSNAIEECPHIDYYFERGSSLFSNEQYIPAIADFQTVTNDKKNGSIKLDAVYFNIGHCYIENGEIDMAIENYSNAIENSSQSTPAIKNKYYYERGITYLEQEKFNAAYADFIESYELLSSDDKAHYYAGIALLKENGKEPKILEQARTEFSKALSINKADSNYWYELGFCDYELNNINDCLSNLKQAIAITPNSGKSLKAQDIILRINAMQNN